MMQLQTLCTVSLQLVFNGCLPAKRELLHSHYAWAGTEKIAHHRQMADKLGCRQMRSETGCLGARAGQSARQAHRYASHRMGGDASSDATPELRPHPTSLKGVTWLRNVFESKLSRALQTNEHGA
jgi:hypothetical protein